MNISLNDDILAGKWKQVKGKVRATWGKLSDNQIERIAGNYEQLVGAIQEKYGYTKDRARAEVDAFINHLG